MLYTSTIPTPLGEMIALTSSTGLCLLEFADQKHLEREIAQVHKARGARGAHGTQPGSNAVLTATASQLAEYFAGQREHFELALDLIGTEFQQAVWRALLQIPYGQTWSYAREASFIGRPRATRAVANANGQNKISIIIPCHRVIGSDGQLTGYGGGLNRKLALLSLEGARSAPAQEEAPTALERQQHPL